MARRGLAPKVVGSLLIAVALGGVGMGVAGLVNAMPMSWTGQRTPLKIGFAESAETTLTQTVGREDPTPLPSREDSPPAAMASSALVQVAMTPAHPELDVSSAQDAQSVDFKISTPSSPKAVRASLAAVLAQTARKAEVDEAGKPNSVVADAVKTALQDVIVNAGETPFDVRAALQSVLLHCETPSDAMFKTDENVPLACPQNPASIDAIRNLLKVVVAAIDQQDAPAAGGVSGVAAFSSATPPPQGTGGSNYQSF